jgi:hypothetical protein
MARPGGRERPSPRGWRSVWDRGALRQRGRESVAWERMSDMDWIRRNMTAIGIVVVLAMLMPFLLVLFGVIAF